MPFMSIDREIRSMSKGSIRMYENNRKDSDRVSTSIKNFLEILAHQGVIKIVETNSINTTIERL